MERLRGTRQTPATGVLAQLAPTAPISYNQTLLKPR